MRVNHLLSTTLIIGSLIGSVDGAALIESCGIVARAVSQYAVRGAWMRDAVRHITPDPRISALKARSSDPTRSFRRWMSSRVSTPIEIANPCIDAAFQYGLSHSDVASNLLNAVLGFSGDQTIEDVTPLMKTMQSSDPLSLLAYRFTVDFRCRTREGRHFLVEMQNDFRDDYHMKGLIEHSRMLSQLDVSQSDHDAKRRAEKNKNDKNKFWIGVQGVYSIIITNKAFDPRRFKSYYTQEPLMEPALVNKYELRNVDHLNRHYGDIPNQIVLFMLANLVQTKHRHLTPVEQWARLLYDPTLRSGIRKIPETKEITHPEELTEGNPAIEKFITLLSDLPPEIRDKYHPAIKYYNDTIIDMTEKATAIGHAEGRAEGHAKGEKAKAIEVAKKMLKRNRPIEEIIEDTGLAMEEIESLRPHCTIDESERR